MTEIPNQVQKWFKKADSDLKSLKILLSADDSETYGTICYLAQQATEKYLKGFLLLKGVEPPKTHDLNHLLKLCQDNTIQNPKKKREKSISPN